MQLEPLLRAADKLCLSPRLFALDANKPSLLSDLGSPEVCVIGKINHFDDTRVENYAMAILASVARMKAREAKIVILYCDHLASRECLRGDLYRELLQLADHCIVPSRAMASLAHPYLNNSTPVTIIEDPWQVRLQPYTALKLGEPLRLAWFGSVSNIRFACSGISSLMASITSVPSVEFYILSHAKAIEMLKPVFYEAKPFAQRPWSLVPCVWNNKKQPDQLEKFLGSAHVAWIPSDPYDLLKAGISHNRLVDAVRSGCIPVASEMVSYLELRRIALLGQDHGALINDLLDDYTRISSKHEEIRSGLLDRFSPHYNASCWESILLKLSKSKINKNAGG